MRRPLAIVTLLLVLVAGGCGGGEEAAPTAEEFEGTVQTETQQAAGEGNAAAGKELFAAQGCGGCHAFEAAGSNGTTGPDLDESLQGDDAEYIRESIVDPSADLVEGFPDIMPKDYDDKLTDEQLADLVAFLAPK